MGTTPVACHILFTGQGAVFFHMTYNGFLTSSHANEIRNGEKLNICSRHLGGFAGGGFSIFEECVSHGSCY